jgi:3-oxoadipate enol-lactonase
LCRILVDRPDRFERLVFVLPGLLDQRRLQPNPLLPLALAIESGEVERVSEVIRSEIPEEWRKSADADAYVRRRAAALLASGGGVSVALREVPRHVPLAEEGGWDALRRVAAPALVIGCDGDALHPAASAQRLADALGNAQLHIYPRPHLFWRERADLRRRMSEFLRDRLPDGFRGT